jgi:hypothetical protein
MQSRKERIRNMSVLKTEFWNTRLQSCFFSFFVTALETICHVYTSVCPSEITREQLNGFSLNLILRSFTNICRHIPILVKIRQYRVVYMKTHIRFGEPLERDWLNIYQSEECFEQTSQRKMNPHIL